MKRFSLNGSAPKSLNEIACEVVLDYAIANPTSSAKKIRDTFVTACKGCGASHIVETEPEYLMRRHQKSWKRSAQAITIPCGDKLYVTTQWRAGKPKDNFFRFKDVVDREGWGTIV